VGATVAASILLVGALAGPVAAHDVLVSSTPAAGSTLSEVPSEFSVTMNEPLLDLGAGGGFALEVVDAAGRYYGDGCLSISSATLSTGATLGKAGQYSLLWQVVSADGHAVSGQLSFAWAPSPAAELSGGSAAPPACGAPDASPTEVQPRHSPAAHPNASLEPVLGIGAGILALLAAALIAVLVIGRRARP
jgi:methionine-rich copper-binding protein CopC